MNTKIAREFLWLLLLATLALPLTLLFMWIVGMSSEELVLTHEDVRSMLILYGFAYLGNLFLLYFIRWTYQSIVQIMQPPY